MGEWLIKVVFMELRLLCKYHTCFLYIENNVHT